MRSALLTPRYGFDHGCRDLEPGHDNRPMPGEPGYDPRDCRVLLHSACRFHPAEKKELLQKMGAWFAPDEELAAAVEAEGG